MNPKFSPRFFLSLFSGTCSLLFLLFFVAPAYADNEAASTTPPSSRYTELQQSISNRTDEIKKLEAEILEYQKRLQDVGMQKKTLQSAIQTIDLTRAKLGKDIQLTQKKIDQTNDTILTLGRGIQDKQVHIIKNKSVIAQIINKISQTDTATLPEVLLGKNTLSEFFQDVAELDRMQAAVGDSVKSLERLKHDLGEQRTTYQSQQKQLLALNAQLGDQKQLADEQRKDQNNLLAQTKNQESNYKKLLAEKAARKKQFEREVEDYEAQLRAEIDPTSFPAPGTKVLAYPLANVRVTQHFGKTIDARRLYSSGTHNGIDFGAAPGTRITAAGDGVVIGQGDTDRVCPGASYGRWVMIRHKNGLATIYSHLELIKVTQGQSVEVGDLVGYSGSTGYATGPHLHFGLFVSSAVSIRDLPSKSCPGAIFHIPVAPLNAYLDPEAYL